NLKPSADAGKPNRKGVGPAQECWRNIIKYRAEHPKATWRELFQKIPNHYSNHKNMYSAMRMLQERLAWQTQKQEAEDETV
ncbi:unnamed protein product, partial [marine sediment metagenome]